MSSTAQFRRSSKSSASGSLPPDRCSTLGYRRLAARVIAQALRDLQGSSAGDQQSAQAFLNGSAMLGFWCDLAEIRPGYVVARAATFRKPAPVAIPLTGPPDVSPAGGGQNDAASSEAEPTRQFLSPV